MLVLQFQSFHEMTEDGKSGICEVWCGKGDANSIEEGCDNMFGTMTVFDLGLERCQMLEFGINRCSTLQGSKCIASQSLHFIEGMKEEEEEEEEEEELQPICLMMAVVVLVYLCT